MNPPNRKVDILMNKAKQWPDELRALRAILLQTPLVEEVKWRAPCYTYRGNNVALLGAFKESCVLSFIKGVLLKDPQHILVSPGENTQSARIARFTSVKQIQELESVIKAYVGEAIEIEEAGLKVEFKPITKHSVPEELQRAMDKDPALKAAFERLTPGRRRAYMLFISGAKQVKTREARVEKCSPKILAGKGLDD